MTITALILTAIALMALAWGARYLYDFVANDGLGRLPEHHHPPRSHPS